jgi:hypothetical protein
LRRHDRTVNRLNPFAISWIDGRRTAQKPFQPPRAVGGLMVRSLLAATLVLAILVAGCSSSTTSLGGIPAGSPPKGDGAGTAAAHAQPTRDESGITVKQENGKTVASKTVTLTNDFGGASKSTVTLATQTGGAAARSWASGGYKTVVVLQSRAGSEELARQGLSRMTVVHNDDLAGGTLKLDTHVDFQTTSCDSTLVACLSASITANLPSQPAYTLDITADTGGVSVDGLGGPSAKLTTDTGGVDASGAFGRVTAKTSTGGIQLDGIANSVDATADTGGVKATLLAKGSGTWTLHTNTGGVEVIIERASGQGVDADATTDTGGVSVDLSGSHDVGAQSRTHAHKQTEGLSTAAIQTTVKASADTGGVDVGER